MVPKPAPADDATTRTVERLTLLCEERGLEMTGARQAVLQTVLGLRTHPTADEVHAAAGARLPGVGRATVYRALEALVRVGALTKASHTGSAVRYDTVHEPHHHLVCLRCDRIADLRDDRLDAVPVPDTSKHGFTVVDVQVQLRGLCAPCRREENHP